MRLNILRLCLQVFFAGTICYNYGYIYVCCASSLRLNHRQNTLTVVIDMGMRFIYQLHKIKRPIQYRLSCKLWMDFLNILFYQFLKRKTFNNDVGLTDILRFLKSHQTQFLSSLFNIFTYLLGVNNKQEVNKQ